MHVTGTVANGGAALIGEIAYRDGCDGGKEKRGTFAHLARTANRQFARPLISRKADVGRRRYSRSPNTQRDRPEIAVTYCLPPTS